MAVYLYKPQRKHWILKPPRNFILLISIGLNLICFCLYSMMDYTTSCEYIQFTNTTEISSNKVSIVESKYIIKTFLIEEERFCTKRPDLKIIVYIHSAIGRTENRKLTRDTWGSGSANGVPMAVVFVVGRAETEEEQDIVRSESNLYNDIVQGNYNDGYKLLTYKSLNSLFWVYKNCAEVPWTMHADDDIMVNVYRLMNRIEMIEFENNYDYETSFYCNVYYNYKVHRKGKWKIDMNDYSKSYYPTYCQGPLWLIPTRYIPNLLNEIAKTNIFWIDDVYVTGILAEAGNIRHQNIPYLNIDIGYRIKDFVNQIGWLTTNTKLERINWWNDIKERWSKYYNNSGKWIGRIDIS